MAKWADPDSNQECPKTADLQSAALPIPLTDPYVFSQMPTEGFEPSGFSF